MTTKEERQHGFTFSDAGRALHDGRITTNDTKHVARQITESLFAHQTPSRSPTPSGRSTNTAPASRRNTATDPTGSGPSTIPRHGHPSSNASGNTERTGAAAPPKLTAHEQIHSAASTGRRR